MALLRLPCHAHISASAHAVVASIVDEDTTRVRKYCQALRAPGEMSKFRKAWAVMLREKVKLVDAVVLTREATAYKLMVLDTFVPKAAA